MRVLGSRVSAFVAPIALLLALIYTQVAWHKDRTTYAYVISMMRLAETFPSDGDAIATSAMRVIHGADTVSLARLVHGRRAVIYFERPDCPVCSWFAVQMDSILPDWRDSLVVVQSYDPKHGPAPEFMLDSASTFILPAVPALLVVDSNGFVRHSVPAGLPPITHVLDFLGIPSPGQLLLNLYTDSVHATPTVPGPAT